MEYEVFPDKAKEVSFYELVETFPTAVALMKKNLKKEISELMLDIELLEIQRQSYKEGVMQGYCETLKKEKEEKLTQAKLHLLYLSPQKDTEVFVLTTQDIWRAKQRPIRDIIKVNSASKAVCLFHSDKQPSMHIYGTTYYCFTCNAKGSVVDIIMKLRNCSFVSAVRFLISK